MDIKGKGSMFTYWLDATPEPTEHLEIRVSVDADAKAPWGTGELKLMAPSPSQQRRSRHHDSVESSCGAGGVGDKRGDLPPQT
jgi:hypothetical protein